ncbi:MAG TPA: ATP-dependent sacrificial sulfur transferase LarE [Firmicutes bacterium]|nr:ATP-dependent sacrificial sulfur transferase LarE [Bacillota bacterium]
MAEKKAARLRELLAGCNGAVVAFSGGVDSTFLAKVAHDVLGDKVLMVTATSPAHPEQELQAAKNIAAHYGFQHLCIRTNELENELYCSNPPERCYFCKQEIIGQMWQVAREYGFGCVFDGANVDDTSDFRPGARAAQELGVRSPLQEAGLTKAEIRFLSQKYGLPTWNKPSFACLATRFPYGERITAEKLAMAGAAEAYLRSLGIGQLRVRQHQHLARIEVLPEDLPLIMQRKEEITARLKALGYIYITVDLQGYRSGSMNEVCAKGID